MRGWPLVEFAVRGLWRSRRVLRSYTGSPARIFRRVRRPKRIMVTHADRSPVGTGALGVPASARETLQAGRFRPDDAQQWTFCLLSQDP